MDLTEEEWKAKHGGKTPPTPKEREEHFAKYGTKEPEEEVHAESLPAYVNWVGKL